MARTKHSKEDSESELDEGEYEVEAIIAHRPKQPGLSMSEYEYRVKWKGYNDKTWEDYANLKIGSHETVKKYFLQNLTLAKPSRKAKARTSKSGTASSDEERQEEGPPRKRGRTSSAGSKRKSTSPHKEVEAPIETEEEAEEPPEQATDEDESSAAAEPPPPSPKAAKSRSKPKPAVNNTRDSSPVIEPKRSVNHKTNGGVGRDEEEETLDAKAQERLNREMARCERLSDWEAKIVLIETVERHGDGEEADLFFRVVWDKDLTFGFIPKQKLYIKAPQLVIAFYEKNLKFS